jgi:hypothetical protein
MSTLLGKLFFYLFSQKLLTKFVPGGIMVNSAPIDRGRRAKVNRQNAQKAKSHYRLLLSATKYLPLCLLMKFLMITLSA